MTPKDRQATPDVGVTPDPRPLDAEEEELRTRHLDCDPGCSLEMRLLSELDVERATTAALRLALRDAIKEADRD